MEISPFSLRYRRRHGARWQRQLAEALAELPAGAALHLAIRRLTAQVALPFEVRAARDYSRSCGVPWRPLDLGFLSRRHLPRYGPELLARPICRPCSPPPTALGGVCGRGVPPGPAGLGASPPAAHLPRSLRDPAAGTGPGPATPGPGLPGIAGWCTWAAGSTWWPGRTPPACGVIWRI